jgi:hypothetical protein
LVEASQTPGLHLRLRNSTRKTKPNHGTKPSRGKTAITQIRQAGQKGLSIHAMSRHDSIARVSATATGSLGQAGGTSQAMTRSALRTR